MVGTYALRPDDRCIFLAADFDGEGWRGDVAAYRDAAACLGINCLVEISRSGNGAHGWIFFAEPVKASEARTLGSLILARAASNNPQIRLDTLFLCMPISFKGRLIQYVGRLHRPNEGKTTVTIYDYLDERLAIAASMFRKRCTGYRQLGYRISHDSETSDGFLFRSEAESDA